MIKRLIRGGKFLVAALFIACTAASLHTAPSLASEPGKVVLTIQQLFTNNGITAPPGETFAYRLAPEDEGIPMPEGSGTGGYTFTISGTGVMDIAPIAFAQEGLYRYEVSCISAMGPGYATDRQSYAIEVRVRSDLTAIVLVYKDNGDKASGISFAHSYGKAPTDPTGAPLVVKTVFGNPEQASAFAFLLTAGNPSNPMPAGSANGVKTVYITGSGSADFGAWRYTEEGIYYYTVYEMNTGIPGYTYDTMAYTIKDFVRAEGDQLVLTRTVTNRANNQVSSFSFINTYTPGGTVTPPPTIPPTIPPTVPPTIPPTAPPPEITPPTVPPEITPEQPPAPPEVTIEEEAPPAGPAPNFPGNILVPGDGGSYIELDEDGAPVGKWEYDEENDIWIFEEFPVPSAPYEPGKGPKTGDESNATMYIALIFTAGLMAAGSFAYLLASRRREKERDCYDE